MIEQREPVPEVDDDLRLAVVQAQIEALQVDLCKLEALRSALPARDPREKGTRDDAKRTAQILANYRKQEGELLGRLNQTKATL